MQAAHKSIAAILFLAFSCSAPSHSIPIDGVALGANEKGVFLGLHSNISRGDQLELGLQFFQGNLLEINAGLSKDLSVNVSSTGGRLAFYHFLRGNSRINGLFIQGALNLQRIAADIPVKLDTFSYNLDGISLRCRKCGSARLRTQKPSLELIPSIAIGWQLIISEKFSLRAIVGAQLYNFPEIEWQSSETLPKYVRQELSSATKNINQQFKGFGMIYPALDLSIVYSF